jgi:recombination protein RecA
MSGLGVGLRHQGLQQALVDMSAERRPKLDFSTKTGVVSLDRVLGGGLPSGATEIYGNASVGKSTLLYEIIKTAQGPGGMQVALCPSEFLDLPYMKTVGIDLSGLVLFTGNSGEDVLDAAIDFLLLHRDTPTMVALDSATSLRPCDDSPGRWLQMICTFLTRALRGLPPSSCVVMINQVRTKRSIDPRRTFVGNEVSSTAQRILGSFSARLELSRGGNCGGEHEMLVDVVASSHSKPSVVVPLPVIPGIGIDSHKDLLRVAMSRGVVTKVGSWFHFNEARLGNGIVEVLKLMKGSDSLYRSILDQVGQRA